MENGDFRSDILLQVKHLSKCIRQDFDDRLMAHGLTSQQGRVLFFIVQWEKNNFDVHMSDIQSNFCLSKSSVSELISRMIKNDLVIKEQGSPYCLIKPSNRGRNIVKEIKDNRQTVIDKLLDGFDANEKQLMIDNMQRMINNMGKEK